jgi:Ca2+-binding RTX toxin-like protein
MLAAIVLASLPVGAGASSVSNGLTVGTITFTGGGPAPENPDNVTFTKQDFDGVGYYVFTDPNNAVTGTGSDPNPLFRCGAVPATSPPAARCPAAGVVMIDISLQEGSDTLKIESSASPLQPPPGTPRIRADGGAGDDTETGGDGPESLTGGPGTDHLNGLGGDDRLELDALDPTAAPTAGPDTLDGGDGDDQLGSGPAGVMQEGDTLIGGAGVDTADYSDRTASLNIDLDGGGDDGQSGEHDNVEPDVERVIAGSDDDTLVGSGANNFLDGRNGDDRISGGGGDDVLDGGGNSPGSDSLDGGAGGDALYGRAGDDELDGGAGNDSLAGAGGTDTLNGEDGNDGLEGGAGGDTVNGGAGNDVVNGAAADLTGADGADDLRGGAGTDTLLGVDGNDKLDGGPDADVMDGGDGTDTVDYEGRPRKVTVTLDDVANDGEPLEGDNVRRNVENVLGGTLGDDLSGDSDANTLDGGPGEDLVVGNGGVDMLQGGNAPDVIWARDGKRDRVNCGDDGDLAITDPEDAVRDCTWEDPGGKRRLAVARSALVIGDTYKFRLPDGRRYYQFEDPLKLPIGSTIDARDGAVRLATARNSDGVRQEISILGGPFSVRQEAGKRPTTDLRLVGRPRGCGRSASAPRAPADARVPKLDMRTDDRRRGRYRVKGRHSIGAPRGTSWVTEERCDGTFTQVRSGTVKVRDLERDRTVVLHAGETYLARPR